MTQEGLWIQEPQFKIVDSFAPDADAVLGLGDSLELLKNVPNEQFKLIVTSPPYNIGKSYEKVTGLDQYIDSMNPIVAEFSRALSSQGSLCWQVGNYVDDGEVVPLDIVFYPLFKRHGFKLRNRIIWHFDHGLHASKRFSGRYETLLWFTKSDSYTFNLDSVRVPSKYPSKRHFKGDKRGQLSGNPLGKNPSDIWRVVEQDWESTLWNIPNVKSNHPEKTIHPCQFPIELVERCVLALTNEDDWVLDPFAGVGSSLIAALGHGRHGMSCEKDEQYVLITKQRIAALADGTLGYRPLGKPVYAPKPTEKLAQVPIEWLVKEDP